ncbi:MAG: 1-deoxy-D-xylulose-5-phosphate synthase [Acidobacteria bacterium]|nr:1-deoxy-D-xylulose-5-phosphate synthase [Acidobacteriota bacterium]
MLEKVNYPSDLKRFSIKDLEELAPEIRRLLIDVVSKTGGHLASNLGIVELTIALHYVFDLPTDKIIWDVSHQCYVHKILTGRKDRLHTLRQYEGISGFSKREESEYDAFNAGHASTSISAALGMAVGRDMSRRDNHVIAVIGDGSLTGGMAMEAVNQAGHLGKKLIIILNDNEMSISPNVGAWSGYLKRIIDGQAYTLVARDVQAFLKSIPGIGDQVLKTTRNVVDALKTFMVPGKLLEELGLQYIGPVNGHSIQTLVDTLDEAREKDGPLIIHVVTRKGKGYAPAEKDPDKWHGASPFNILTGKGLKSSDIPSYTDVFGETLLALGRKDPKVVAVTAAMLDGTGVKKFKEEFPERCFDVGIAEQHAVTFAAGLAAEGYRPVVAIYSTFLQRAYDQVFHDVCLMKLPVVFVLDRAGVVGEDGPTHHGLYDLAYLRCLPNMVVMAPKDEDELRHMLETAVHHNGPIAVRYPRGTGLGMKREGGPHTLPLGKGEVLRQGKGVCLVALGGMVHPALHAAEKLAQKNIQATVVNARFVKPLDEALFKHLLPGQVVVTLEEGILPGGFGSAVLEFVQEAGLSVEGFKRIGIPDRVIPAGSQKILRARYRLDAAGIADTVEEFLEKIGWPKKGSTASLLQWDWLKPAKRQKR